jgi:lipopolysaccharide exporter
MSLRLKTVTGMAWTASAISVISLLQFTNIAILTHFLSPADFGLMAIVSILIGYALVYADMGVSKAIVCKKEVTTEQLSSLYWLNIVIGYSLFLLFVICAPFFAKFYHEPRLTSLIVINGLVFCIIPFGQQFQILLTRELDFRSVTIIQIIGALANLTVAYTAVRSGYGVYSLAFGQIANNLIQAVMLVIKGIFIKSWRPKLHFNKKDLIGYVGFGMYQMGERTIYYFGGKLDQILLSFFCGAQNLGYYNLAVNVVIQPLYRVNGVLTQVLFPIFSKIQDDTVRLRNGYLQMIRFLSMINAPMVLGLAVLAEPFVKVFFGPKWFGIIELLQVLVFVGFLRSIGNPIGALVLAKGRADLGFKWNLMIFFPQIIAVTIGAKYFSIVGLARIILVLEIIYFYPCYVYLIKQIVGPCFKKYFFSFAKNMGFAICMGIVLFLINKLFFWKYTNFFVLGMSLIVGSSFYLALQFIFNKREIADFRSTLGLLFTSKK